MRLCRRCGKDLTGKQKSFCRLNCKNNFYVTANRRKTKLKAVALLGGKCQRCGYKKCIRALGFHHKDPTKKEFRIGNGFSISWARVEKELKGCILLCANCHMEEEDSIYNAS